MKQQLRQLTGIPITTANTTCVAENDRRMQIGQYFFRRSLIIPVMQLKRINMVGLESIAALFS